MSDQLEVIFIVSTFFALWSLNLILTKVFKIEPKIRRTASLELPDFTETNPNPNMLMSKALDGNNEYRMQLCAATYFTEGILMFLVCTITFIGFMYTDSSYYYKQLILLDHTTINNVYYKFFASCIMAIYLWSNVVLRRYHKTNWMGHIHHWATILVSAAALNGVFIPFNLLFGTLDIWLISPVIVHFGFRIIFCTKWPVFTQKISLFLAYYWLIAVIICYLHAIPLIIHCFFNTDKVSIYVTISFAILSPAFARAQFALYPTLKRHSRQNYSSLTITMVKQMGEEDYLYGNDMETEKKDKVSPQRSILGFIIGDDTAISEEIHNGHRKNEDTLSEIP